MSATSTTFGGLRVAAFESRRAPEMARLIERLGGVPSVSPSLREVPLADAHEAVDFANRLLTGQIDIVILLTGVGTRLLLAAVERRVERQRFLDALADAVTVVRGPKPLAVLRELGIEPKFRVPEPNTWREVLRTLDAELPIANQTVALQEYGQPNPSLVAGLEARGATVVPVRVYEWGLPEDTAPLEANVRAICAGDLDVAMFTSPSACSSPTNCGAVSSGWSSPRSAPRRARRCVLAGSPSISSPSIPRWGTWCWPLPSAPPISSSASAASPRCCRAAPLPPRPRAERPPPGTIAPSCGRAADSRPTASPSG